jgi:hypothetical protein
VIPRPTPRHPPVTITAFPDKSSGSAMRIR